MMPEPARKVGLLLCVLAAFALAGCKEVEIQSQWRTRPIAMDGSRGGWPEDVQYFDKESRMLVAIMNDEKNLYIRLVTRSETTRRMLVRAGFTVWLDETGAAEKKFGVQFPLARQNRPRQTIPDHKPRTGMQEILADSQYNLAILRGAAGNRQTMPLSKAEEMGIYARLSMQQSHLIYELKVPLSASRASKTIAIGFESGTLAGAAGRGMAAGGGMGGGRGGGGRGGGGGGGKGGQRAGGRPQPVEIWANVQLADRPAT